MEMRILPWQRARKVYISRETKCSCHHPKRTPRGIRLLNRPIGVCSAAGSIQAILHVSSLSSTARSQRSPRLFPKSGMGADSFPRWTQPNVPTLPRPCRCTKKYSVARRMWYGSTPMDDPAKWASRNPVRTNASYKLPSNSARSMSSGESWPTTLWFSQVTWHKLISPNEPWL